MSTPWDRARKRKSELQEQRNAKLEGGSKQVNSGRFWRFKRDNILHEFLIESRTTDKGSYSVSKEEFQRVKQDALQTPPGLLPGMQVDIQDLSLIVMELKDFQEREIRLIQLEAEREENGDHEN